MPSIELNLSGDLGVTILHLGGEPSWWYNLPDNSALDFKGDSTEYAAPLGGAVDFPTAGAGGVSQVFLAAVAITDAYFGSTPCQVYVGSTLVFG